MPWYPEIQISRFTLPVLPMRQDHSGLNCCILQSPWCCLAVRPDVNPASPIVPADRELCTSGDRLLAYEESFHNFSNDVFFYLLT
jgi:hypothetical protein